MRKVISYEKNTKTEKNEKPLKIIKIYNIIILKTIRNKLTALCNLIHTILNYNLVGPVRVLRLSKEKKAKIAKKMSEKCVEAIKNKFFSKNFSAFN